MKKEDFIIDEWVIWTKEKHFYYLLISKIDTTVIHYSEYINVNSKRHEIGNSVYSIDDESLKKLVDISEVQKYLPLNHSHHNKIKIKPIDDLEPLIKLLKEIE